MYDKLIDAEGRYVILLCRIYQLKCILAALYIQPPFNSEVLRTLLAYWLSSPDIHVIMVGDFNCFMDPALDKYPLLVAGRKIA